MKNTLKKVMASVMAVASLAVGMTGISASAAGYCGAGPGSEVIDGLTYYYGYGYADGSTIKVKSGYINTSGGRVYATGSSTYKETPHVAAPATSGTGVFTFAYSTGVTFDIPF